MQVCYTTRQKQIGNNWFYGEVTLKTDEGHATKLTSLSLNNGYNTHSAAFQRLVCQFKICFHGLGGGSERQSTTEGLFANQCWITDDHSLFYNAVHDKQSSVKTPARSATKHKMPPSIVPLYLLFRQICMAMDFRDSPAVIPEVDTGNYTMKQAMCTHFGIDHTNVSALDIRKFFSTVTNIIFREHSEENKLVASEAGAKMNNHSHAVHDKHYSTHRIGAEAMRFVAYHSFLGEDKRNSERNFSITTDLITETQQHRALQCLFGQLAAFNDDKQKEMIECSSNSHKKHKFYGLRCGGGKSTSVIIPYANEMLMMSSHKCRIVVNPYCFLNESVYEGYVTTLQQFHDEVSIVAHTASAITEDSVPEKLSIDCPPDILILTLDAAANLIQYHPVLIRTWGDNNLLHGVWFDEIQGMYDEFNFRSVYQQLPLYSSLGVPISVLSGSMPKQLTQSVMSYLKLIPPGERTLDSIDCVHSTDLIGSGFRFDVVLAKNIIQVTILLIEKKIKESQHAIHVLCSSKQECTMLADSLKESIPEVAELHADVPQAEQKTIAQRWYRGEIKILVSTTIGIVGNENKKMKHIYCVRLLYSLSNFVQAIGRLRPKQRGQTASVTLVVEEKDLRYNNYVTNLYDNNRTQLVDAGVLRNEDISIFNSVFHIDGFKAFLNKDGCYISRLRKIFSGNEGAQCSNCTWCIHRTRHLTCSSNGGLEAATANRRPAQISNPYKKQKVTAVPQSKIQVASATAAKAEQIQIETRNRADRILAWLTKHCPRCKSGACAGDVCAKGCFICGSTSHQMSGCSLYYKNPRGKNFEKFINEAKVCNWCYAPIDNGEKHGPEFGKSYSNSRCTLQNRLRCAIILGKKQESFEKCVRRIHADRKSFYKFISELSTVDIFGPNTVPGYIYVYLQT